MKIILGFGVWGLGFGVWAFYFYDEARKVKKH